MIGCTVVYCLMRETSRVTRQRALHAPRMVWLLQRAYAPLVEAAGEAPDSSQRLSHTVGARP